MESRTHSALPPGNTGRDRQAVEHAPNFDKPLWGLSRRRIPSERECPVSKDDAASPRQAVGIAPVMGGLSFGGLIADKAFDGHRIIAGQNERKRIALRGHGTDRSSAAVIHSRHGRS
jgi:hypothetical protein